MRDLRSGNKTNERWRTADTVERLMTEEKEYTYSYTDGSNMVLMDPESFEQTMVSLNLLGDAAPFLQDNMHVTVGPSWKASRSPCICRRPWCWRWSRPIRW